MVITFYSSRRLVLLFLLTGMCFALLPLLIMQHEAHFAITLCICALMMTVHVVWRDALLQYPWSCKLLRIDKTGTSCQLVQQNGRQLSFRILPSSYVKSYLTILQLAPEGDRTDVFWRRRAILLVPDNCPSDTFRQLRVYLLFGKNSF